MMNRSTIIHVELRADNVQCLLRVCEHGESLHPADADAIAGRLRAAVVESQNSDAWDDKPDEWTPEIEKAFPTRSGSHEAYGTAMRMVGNRHSKRELVALVNWLLVRLESKGTR
jgi:hypothetical protein